MVDCLIIDDDVSIAATIHEYFTLFNLSCVYETDYEAGLKTAASQHPTLIIMDVNLGEESGFALCKKLRETSDVPIIFISVRNSDDDVLAALGVGGDDYVTKPFSMAVLLAKARAILKRSAAAAEAVAVAAAAAATATGAAATAAGAATATAATEETGTSASAATGAATAAATATETAAPQATTPVSEYTATLAAPNEAATSSADFASPAASSAPRAPREVTRFGGVEIDRGSGRVTRDGEPVKLKPMEYKLLLYLIDNKDIRVTKDELLENVWGDTFIGEGTLSVHIRHLREKLEETPNNPRYIKTVWGSGYIFEEI